MRNYVAILILMIAVMVLGSTAYSSRWSTTQKSESTAIKLVVDQLDLKEESSLVQILRPSVFSSKPNRIEDVSYSIKNNTLKGITALVVNKIITYEVGGSRQKHSGYSSVDYELHPDVGAGKVFEPESEIPMDSSPIEFEANAFVREIRLKVDYVLFHDNSAIGNGGEGEQKINLMREGARRFKGLLVQRYQQNGKVNTILPLLENKDTYQDLHLNDDVNLSMGADQYRLYLLKKLQTKGPSEVEKFVR